MGEFRLIRRITGRLASGVAVDLGPGDDAAVLRTSDGRVVASTDLLVEGRHFRRDWSGPYDVGRKAAATNLADIAAMGARPTALLVGFGAPPETTIDYSDALCDGLRDECAIVGAAVVGGDVVRAEAVILAVTALGDLGGRAPLTRSGARPGDVVAVTGRLGHAAAGLELLSAGRDGPAELIAAHRRPTPPYAAGIGAVRLGATAMLDVSDGLVQDLGHIAAASGVGVEIDSAALPVPRALSEASSEPLRLILTGGDDHALAATFPAAAALSDDWRVVGGVVSGDGGVTVDGRPYDSTGWDHFH